MKVQQYPITKYIRVNGSVLTVPLNTEYVTLEKCGVIKAWPEKPNFIDGWFNSSKSRPTCIGEYEGGKEVCISVK